MAKQPNHTAMVQATRAASQSSNALSDFMKTLDIGKEVEEQEKAAAEAKADVDASSKEIADDDPCLSPKPARASLTCRSPHPNH
ncbi:hypothetical protein GCM10027578_27720 [Spirosoma luteolum]